MDPYAVPKAQNMFVELPAVQNDLTVEDIAQRIHDNKDKFEAKFAARKAKQDDYYLSKLGSLEVDESENPETTTS